MNTIDLLCRAAATIESTMTTSIASTGPGPMTVIQPKTAPAKSKKPKLADLLNNRKLAQEGAPARPAIPDDAKPDETSMGGEPGSSRQTEEPANGRQIEPLLPTSVALVAPDTTPDAEAPLDPSQAPQPTSQEVATLSTPIPIDNGNDVLRTLIGSHQESFKPALITDPKAAAAVVEKMLNNPGDGNVTTASSSAKAAAVMADAHAGKIQKHHHNPESMDRAIAVTRSILGM